LIELLRQHARESFASMVHALEPGQPWLLRVGVVHSRTGAAIPGATFAMHHTDHAGYYFREKTLANVRLAGVVRVDAMGGGFISSILPGYYASSEDPDGVEPRHVHISVRAAGNQDLVTGACFDDDSGTKDTGVTAITIHMQPRQGAYWRGEIVVRLRARGHELVGGRNYMIGERGAPNLPCLGSQFLRILDGLLRS
tara:strand:+ start:827 stop:1417 length:591 start_codon:yes stop_codon:yes gene_type:complete